MTAKKPELALKLDRPMAVFDIEATGATPRADRIVELAILRVHPDGHSDSHVFRINPEMPIPPEATAIHGISDEDVRGCPTFKGLSGKILELFSGCDLAGYNVLRFDIPMLVEEFLRAGIRFDPDNYRVVDAQRIYHRKEPRDLTAALSFYCSEMHLGAHGAEADTLATLRVLNAQVQRYADLPKDVAALSDYCDPRDATWADRQGRLRWVNGHIALNFGKKKGTRLSDMIKEDPGFLKWILRSDFPRDVKELVENAMQGRWPAPPEAPPKEE
jgi:DNA polymerase III subunit epsilon